MRLRRAASLLALACLLTAGAAAAGRIVAVGDVHGEIEGLDSVLRAAELIDGEGNWIGGEAVLVQTGDMTDRGSRVREVMDRLRSLQEQAPAQGGRVVVLLGNHEVSNLLHVFDYQSTPPPVYAEIWANFGDERSEKRQKSAYRQWYRWLQRYPGCVEQQNRAWVEDRSAWLAAHPPGFVEYLEALSAEGEYGSWLRGLDVAVAIDGDVFLHGGLSPELVEQGYRSVAEINREARQAFERFDADRRELIHDDLIVPFSTLWELHCALFVEMARLEEDGEPKALRRRAELEELRSRLPGMPGWFLIGENGPLWYRGLALAEEEELGPRLRGLLEVFDARRIAVGHTPQNGEIRSRFDGRVYLIDTAMAYPEMGGRAAALEIDGDRVTAIYADERVELAAGEEPGGAAGPASAPAPSPEERPSEPDAPQAGHEPIGPANGGGLDEIEAALDGSRRFTGSTNGQDQSAAEATASDETPGTGAAPERPWLGPDGEPLPFTDTEEILAFLANAKVQRSTAVAVGVTLPRKVLLEHDGVQAHAIFHDVAIEKQRERLRGGQVVTFFRDHYADNVAAFELSRMLGMTNVPPAVVRRMGRDKGSMQLWIEGSRTETDRRRLKLAPPGDWRLTAKDMHVFDNLINNIDRNQGNMLFDSKWNLWFIDHTRAFGRTEQLPSPERIRRCSRRLYDALRQLDEAELRERLKPYLGIWEIKGIMKRRDRLVTLIDERIAAVGEAAVLFDYGEAEPAPETADPDVPEAPPEP